MRTVLYLFDTAPARSRRSATDFGEPSFPAGSSMSCISPVVLIRSAPLPYLLRQGILLFEFYCYLSYHSGCSLSTIQMSFCGKIQKKYNVQNYPPVNTKMCLPSKPAAPKISPYLRNSLRRFIGLVFRNRLRFSIFRFRKNLFRLLNNDLKIHILFFRLSSQYIPAAYPSSPFP